MAASKEQRPIFQINFPPGFSRDGTVLDAGSYRSGQWVRFEGGRPTKMKGLKEVSMNIPNIVRGAYTHAKDSIIFIYGFGAGKSFITAISEEVSTGISSITALPTLPDSDLYTYQIAVMFDQTGGGTQKIIAHPAKNLDDISNDDSTNIFIADLGVNPPVWSKLQNGSGGEVMVSGGVVALQPFLFYYGSEGFIGNTNANKPNDSVIAPGNVANQVNVASTKIVKGLPLRGSGGSTAGLFWSLDSLIRAYFVGGSVGFKYETISSQTSIFSPSSVIEYDGAYYWIGIDRFLRYNGVVQEVPNNQNLDFFFDNVNYAQRSKIWATKVPRFGEIWWFFPFGQATECTHALIYNIRGNFWFDVELARSAGYFAQVFRYPVMHENVPNADGNYSVYVHEYGLNKIAGGHELAIPAQIETGDFGYPTGGPDGEKPSGQDYWTRITRIEPDLEQTGDMTVQVVGEEFARGETTFSDIFTFGPEDGKIDMREQRRQIRLIFGSNVIDGDFRMGRTIIHAEPGDKRS